MFGLHSRHIVEFLVEMECVFVVIVVTVDSLALLSKETHSALISWDTAGPKITYVRIPVLLLEKNITVFTYDDQTSYVLSTTPVLCVCTCHVIKKKN